MSHNWAICQTGRGHLYCLPISMRDPSGLRSHFPTFYSNSSHNYLWQTGEIRGVDITFVIIHHFLLGYLFIDKVILSTFYRILMKSIVPRAKENLVTISFRFLTKEGMLFSTQGWLGAGVDSSNDAEIRLSLSAHILHLLGWWDCEAINMIIQI